MKNILLLCSILSLVLNGCNKTILTTRSVLPVGGIDSLVNILQIDPLEKISKDYPNQYTDQNDTALVAKGETATFQFLIKMKPEEILNLNVNLDNPILSSGNATLDTELGLVSYVGATVAFDNNPPQMINSPTNRYPDPILPLTNHEIPLDNMQTLWVRIPIPIATTDGIYKGKIKLTGVSLGGANIQIEKQFAVKVYPVSISERRLLVSNWLSVNPKILGKMNNGINVDRNSSEYWDILEEVANVSAKYNSNVYYSWLLHNNTIVPSRIGTTYSFDFVNFDRELEIFQNKGALSRIIGKEIGVRSPDNQRVFLRVPLGTGSNLVYENLPLEDPRTQDFFAQFFPALKNHLIQKGWENIYLQQVIDEPNAEAKDDYIAISQMIKSYFPNVKITDAIFNGILQDFAPGFDVWVPQLPQSETFLNFFQNQMASGKEVWHYVCMYPQGNYANRFIQQPLIPSRLLHWINFKYGFKGFVHWGLNYWDVNDPYQETGIHYMNSPGGDAFITYPGYKKMYPSIRLEAMRDGINDYELLEMLKAKNSALASTILNSIVTNGATFNYSITNFRAQRRILLEALSN